MITIEYKILNDKAYITKITGTQLFNKFYTGIYTGSVFIVDDEDYSITVPSMGKIIFVGQIIPVEQFEKYVFILDNIVKKHNEFIQAFENQEYKQITIGKY